MAVPTQLSDLSTTASSNPPSGSTSIGSEGIDDHLRAGYSFIAQLNANKAPLASPTFTGHVTVEGVTATGATGSGKFVFDASPTLTGNATITNAGMAAPALVAKDAGALPTISAGTVAVLSGNAANASYNTRLAILGGGTDGVAAIDFGDFATQTVGFVSYVHTNDVLYLGTAGNPRVIVEETDLSPYSDNAMSCGTSGRKWSVVYAQTGTINTSDSRLKTDVADSALGLAFINALRPVSYRWAVGGNAVVDENTVVPQAGVRTHWGFLAQEVKAAVDVAGVDFGGWVLTDTEDATSEQGLRYDELIAPLVKAVQELAARVAALEGV